MRRSERTAGPGTDPADEHGGDAEAEGVGDSHGGQPGCRVEQAAGGRPDEPGQVVVGPDQAVRGGQAGGGHQGWDQDDLGGGDQLRHHGLQERHDHHDPPWGDEGQTERQGDGGEDEVRHDQQPSAVPTVGDRARQRPQRDSGQRLRRGGQRRGEGRPRLLVHEVGQGDELHVRAHERHQPTRPEPTEPRHGQRMIRSSGACW